MRLSSTSLPPPSLILAVEVQAIAWLYLLWARVWKSPYMTEQSAVKLLIPETSSLDSHAGGSQSPRMRTASYEQRDHTRPDQRRRPQEIDVEPGALEDH